MDKSPVVRITVGHGQDPHMLFWQHGWVVSRWLAAAGSGNQLAMTALVSKRLTSSRPPRYRPPHKDADLAESDETPTKHQRISAYAIVRSSRGVLGTICSDRTTVPGRWHLPGGGIEPNETPSQAALREVKEETNQTVNLKRVVDLESDHWIGRAPDTELEDFQALRIIYTAFCAEPTDPTVLDIGGTTESSHWVPAQHWRSLPWTVSSRMALEKHLSRINFPITE